ncbi:MAG TPA: rhomboid family intramembrane serine protease, partial [Opitutales bacterium]|nr:rhomboid family intramembrane serine protease [Opitutales bacterium]
GLDGLGFLFAEITGVADGIAHSAHLGGMLAGYLYYRFALDPNRGILALPAWLKPRTAKKIIQNPTYQVNVRDRVAMRQEVDRILDKINAHGFGALSEAEKNLLAEAKDLLG